MEKIINDIILFDKEFDMYKRSKEDELKKERLSYEKSLKDILLEESKLLEDEKQRIIKKYDDMLKTESLSIDEKNKVELDRLKKAFYKIKDSVSKEIFESLIDLRD